MVLSKSADFGRAGSTPAVATIGQVAHLVEHRFEKPGVAGSNPALATTKTSECSAVW